MESVGRCSGQESNPHALGSTASAIPPPGPTETFVVDRFHVSALSNYVVKEVAGVSRTFRSTNVTWHTNHHRRSNARQGHSVIVPVDPTFSNGPSE